jgi:hypothetical protein
MIRCTKIQRILGGRIAAAIDILRFLYEGQKRPKHVVQTVITRYTRVVPEGLFTSSFTMGCINQRNYKVSLLLSHLEQTIHYLAALHFFLLEALFVENNVTLASLPCCHHYGDLILYTSLNIILINPQAIPP